MLSCLSLRAHTFKPARRPRVEMSSEDGETEETDDDFDDDGWESDPDSES